MKKVNLHKFNKEVMKGVLFAGCICCLVLLLVAPYVPIVGYYRTLALAAVMIITSLVYVICNNDKKKK
jgi:hypothetical protein